MQHVKLLLLLEVDSSLHPVHTATIAKTAHAIAARTMTKSDPPLSCVGTKLPSTTV